MSTAPEGWQTPKTNWGPPDPVGPSDFNRIEGNAASIETGDRILDPAQVPTGNVGTLRQILSWSANRVKTILGTTNWHDAPPVTLEGAKKHIDATAVHDSTPNAVPDRIVRRDAEGRASIVAPQTSTHIARLDTVQHATWWQRDADPPATPVLAYTVPGSRVRIERTPIGVYKSLWAITAPCAGQWWYKISYEAAVTSGGTISFRCLAPGGTVVSYASVEAAPQELAITALPWIAEGETLLFEAMTNRAAYVYPPKIYSRGSLSAPAFCAAADPDTAGLNAVRNALGWMGLAWYGALPDSLPDPLYVVPGDTFRGVNHAEGWKALWSVRVPYDGELNIVCDIQKYQSGTVQLRCTSSEDEVLSAEESLPDDPKPLQLRTPHIKRNEQIIVSANVPLGHARVWPPRFYGTRSWPTLNLWEAEELSL